MKLIMKLVLFASLCLLFSSCASPDYYYARSVDRARAKAVKELPVLSDADRFEIRFGRPSVYQVKLLNRSGKPQISKNDVCHTWIVWKLPETKDKCVVVSGVSEARMDDWHPEWVIIRDIHDLEFPPEPVDTKTKEEKAK